MFWSQSSSSRRSVSQAALAVVEGLETRALFSTAVYTGGGDNTFFSNPANWQGGQAPAPGDDIEITAVGGPNSYHLISLDADATIGNLTFDGNGELFAQQSQTLTINGNVSFNGTDYLSARTVFSNGTTVSFNNPGDTALLTHLGQSGEGNGVFITGPGKLTIGTADESYSGSFNVNSASTLVLNASTESNVFVGFGATFAGSGSANSVFIFGGNFVGGGLDSAASFHLNGNLFSMSGTFSTLIQGQTVSYNFDPFNILSWQPTVHPPTSDTLVVNDGPINLYGMNLNVSLLSNYAGSEGDSFTIISNLTGRPVNGTFSGLAEGSTLNVAGQLFTITYQGGDSEGDVVLTYAGSAGSSSVDEDPNDPTPEQPSDPNPETPSDPTPESPNPPLDPIVLPTNPQPTSEQRPVIVAQRTNRATKSARPRLSIEATDTSSLGESGLTYNWSVTKAPAGAKNVVFADNGSNDAKDTTARFRKAGTYRVNCVVTNADGNSVTSTMSIVIQQIATKKVFAPHAQIVERGSTIQFSGVMVDQFGHPMRTQPSVSYEIMKGEGSISSTGLFTASSFGHVVIKITVDNVVGTLGLLIV